MSRYTNHALRLLGAALLFSLPIVAQRTVVVRASAPNEATAIRNGLLQAVQQVAGVLVEADSFDAETYRQIVSKMKESFDATSALTQNVRLASRGFVRGYTVLGRSSAPNGGDVTVELEVTVAEPGEYRADGVYTLQVLEVGLGSQVEDRKGGALVRENLASDLLTMILQTRRFRVLEGEHVDRLDAILDRIRAGGFSPEEQAKLGQKLSADYVVIAELGRFSTWQTRKEPVTLRGTVVKAFPVEQHYRAVLDYRIVDVAALQIVHSGELVVTNDGGQNPLAARPGGESLEQAIGKHLAIRLSDAVLKHVYPMKVALVDAETGDVVLATGGPDRIRVGEVFEVYRPGREIVDPDTGEKLESARTLLGRIEITDVQMKTSTARPIGGLRAADLRIGDQVERAFD